MSAFRAPRRRAAEQPQLSAGDSVHVVQVIAHVRRTDRYSVTIEDAHGTQVTLVVPDEFIVRKSVREGDQIDEATVNELVDVAGQCGAFDRAIAAIAIRGRSTLELEQWLFHRGIESAHARYAVDRLRQLGLLDDQRFADEFVRSRVAGRGASTWSLRQELARKGIPRAVADNAISTVLGEVGADDDAMARREGERKLRTLTRVEPHVAERRLVAYLRRRGFSGRVAVDVTRALLRERGGTA